MRKLLAGLAILLLVLAGCGGPKEGYVVSKRVNPPMDWVWFQPIYSTHCTSSYSGYGKYRTRTQSCSSYQSGVIPIHKHSDECPELTLAQDPQNHPRDTHTVCVDHITYDRTNIGDYYKEQSK
jgi:hypothetical protein